jgi:hypothetical protein
VVLLAHRAHDILDREAGVDQVAVRRDVDVLEVVEQRRPLVPRHALGAVHDVVPVQRRDRDEGHVAHLELGREGRELLDQLVEHLLGEVDEVHLVDAHDQVRDAEQRGDERVAATLAQEAVTRVHQDQREVGGRGARDHVARVVLVPRGVGDDERAPRGREIAVGDVDRDALLALGPQAVGEQGEVHVAVATALGGLADVLELVFEDRLGVVEQAPDQRRLAVVDRTRGGEAQQVDRLLLDGVESERRPRHGRHQK